MEFSNLENRVVHIKNQQEEADLLLDEYIPFIKGIISKVINDQNNDYLTIGMMAFSKAIKTFDITKGKFLSYAKLLIRNQVISAIRKESKYDTIQLKDYQANDQEIIMIRKLELDIFKEKLSKFNISIEDLLQHSPKHKKTRKSCLDIAKIIVLHEDLNKYMYEKQKLPIKGIIQHIKVSDKVFERFRKYIMSLVILQDDQFGYLYDLVF